MSEACATRSPTIVDFTVFTRQDGKILLYRECSLNIFNVGDDGTRMSDSFSASSTNTGPGKSDVASSGKLKSRNAVTLSNPPRAEVNSMTLLIFFWMERWLTVRVRFSAPALKRA